MPCGYDAERAVEEAYEFADELAALGARRVVAVDAAAYFSRPGPRLVDGLELLAHILHPDRVPEPRRRAWSRSRSRRAQTRRPSRPRVRSATAITDATAITAASTTHGAPERERAPALARARSIASAASAPPTRPPMCPPIEMFGIEEERDARG